jgi:hypothetical protein
MIHTPTECDAALRRLTAKYAVVVPPNWQCRVTAETPREGIIQLVPGWALLDDSTTRDSTNDDTAGAFVPLSPWRYERRFVELKRLVDTHTVETVVLCRFSCQTTGKPMSLKGILYREFDLIEWLIDSPIATVTASITDEQFANVLVRTASGVTCSVEAGVGLPVEAKTPMLDRHELIARRGVASDRVVDSQVQQSSVYTFTDHGIDTYTDTDAELFGLDNEQITLVRAAYALATSPEKVDDLRQRHRRLAGLVDLAFVSNDARQRMAVEGACR